jgi:hypothetical protein
LIMSGPRSLFQPSQASVCMCCVVVLEHGLVIIVQAVLQPMAARRGGRTALQERLIHDCDY